MSGNRSSSTNSPLVRARAPLRLGLAGGGTDVSPYCDEYGGLVMNATIDMYAHVTLQARSDGQVRFVAQDYDQCVTLAAEPGLPLNGVLDLHKGVYNRIVQDFNDGKPLAVTLTTVTDAPAGSGLGSSSTLVVSMIKAFAELLGLPLSDYDIARLAFDVERRDVGLHGGRQDQYAAAFGGFNFMEFYAHDRVVVNPLRIKPWIVSELESSIVLYYTGVSRESASIIAEQSSRLEQHEVAAVDAMHRVKEEATEMKECILRGDLASFAKSMQKGWESKKKTASSISNSMIERVENVARENGAYAAKVSGAGGGGFMIFFVDPLERKRVRDALGRMGGTTFSCHFTQHGAEGWRAKS